MTPTECETLVAAAKVLEGIGGRSRQDSCRGCGHEREHHINLGKGEGIWCVDLSSDCDCKRFRLDPGSRPYGGLAEQLRRTAGREADEPTPLVPLRKLTLIVQRDVEDGGYTALVEELPGCVSDGDTVDAAFRGIAEALQGVLSEGVFDR